MRWGSRESSQKASEQFQGIVRCIYFFLLFPCFFAGFILWKLCFINPVVVWLFWSVWLWEGSWQVEWDGEEDESLWCFLRFCGQVLQSCCLFKHQHARCVTSMSLHCNVEAKIQVVAQRKGKNHISKSDSKRESEHPGKLSPVHPSMMLPASWLCLCVVTAVTRMSHQLQDAEFL